MKRILRFKRTTLVIFFVVICIFILAKCINNTNDKTDEIISDKSGAIKNISYQQFAGSAKCAGCHKNIYEDHLCTGHYRTSQPASAFV